MNPIPEWQSRSALLIGAAGVARLQAARILLVGVGGVGGAVAEMLARAGVGHLTLVDGDTVAVSNRNRQLAALLSNVGMPKVNAIAMRLRDINAELDLTLRTEFIRPETADALLATPFDLLIDAIDHVPDKCALLLAAVARNLPTVSSMGAGGKLDPTAIQVADLAKTRGCPLARVVRQRLRDAGYRRGVTAVFSEEPAHTTEGVGTLSYMPNAFGVVAAGTAIRMLLATPDSH